MKLDRLKIIILTILLVIFSMCTYSYAADDNNPKGYTCKFTLTPDKTSVKPGEDITYELKVSDINAGNGIKEVLFIVEDFIESDIFYCKLRNYNEDKWGLLNGGGNIAIYRALVNEQAAGPWKTDETLAKIIFTPKTGVANKTYQTKIKNIKITTDDDSIITLDDITLNIKVDSSDAIEKKYSCNMTFIPDKTSVEPGKDITYELKVSNIDAGDGLKKVQLFVGNYDSSKFDCKVNNYNENKWSIINKEGNITISANNSELWKTDEILAKIIYTPKTGLTNNTYQTKITNIKATTADNSTISLTDTTLNIKVASTQSNGEGTSGNSTSGTGTSGTDASGAGTTGGGTTGDSTSGTGTTGTTGGDISGATVTDGTKTESKTSSEEKSSTTKTTTTANKEKSSSSKSLPYSGDKETVLIISGIVILISTSVWFFIRYKKINI